MDDKEQKATGLTIKIDDWHGLHRGFALELEPGFTALVGPNGAGKTTLLQQIGEFARNEGIAVWEYSNLKDNGSNAKSLYARADDFERLAAVMSSSEGEAVAMNFGSRISELGRAVRNAAEAGKPLIVLLDAIDSGASVDRARDLRDFLDMVHGHDIAKGAEVYIVMAVNHYELAKASADCVDVRTESIWSSNHTTDMPVSSAPT